MSACSDQDLRGSGSCGGNVRRILFMRGNLALGSLLQYQSIKYSKTDLTVSLQLFASSVCSRNLFLTQNAILNSRIYYRTRRTRSTPLFPLRQTNILPESHVLRIRIP